MTRARRAAALAAALLLTACGASHSVTPPPPDTTGAGAFLDTLERRTFNFFWEQTNAANGLTPDRWPTPSFSSIAAVGFALTAYPIGVERGYVARADAAARVLTTLRFFWTAPQDTTAAGATGYKGFFYHFLAIDTGTRYRTVELSTIDSALLLAGALTCQSYFDGPDTTETQIRALAESLYARADWQWAATSHPPAITLAWTPENGFSQYDWKGYNEAMLVYLLALGSPSHPADTAAWSAWTSTYQWGSFYGEPHLGFAPLFGHQYTHVWIDFRGIADAYMAGRGIDYFENSRRAALAQQAYAVANPSRWKGYGAALWGLTASDGPADAAPYHTYFARGADFTEIQDDGTVAPTAAASAIAFAPEIAIPTLLSLRRGYGADLFGSYGFFDALNPSFTGAPTMGHVVPGVGWFDGDYLGIDQGPIVAMIENYRSGLVWRLLRGNPHIVAGLCRAGFTGGWLAGRCP